MLALIAARSSSATPASMFFDTTSSVFCSSRVGLQLHHLGPGVERRDVPRRCVVRVPGFVELFLPIREGELQPALHDIAHVWALTVVIGQADEKRCEFGVGCVGLEADGV